MTTKSRSPAVGSQPSAAAARPRPPARAGGWYFLVTVVSLGLLAWLPFVHAASRPRSRKPKVLNVVYAVAAVAIVVLVSLNPDDTADMTAAYNTNGVVTGLLISCVVISALLTQASLRRQVYPRFPATAGGCHEDR